MFVEDICRSHKWTMRRAPRSHYVRAIDSPQSGKEPFFVSALETLGFTSAQPGREPTPAARPVRAPDLGELETLVACAAEGSLVAAAARLGISRPAVAKRIGNLEALAGQALLHRSGRGVRLTDAGAGLFANARRVLDERDALLTLMTEIRGEGPSPIQGLRELLGHSPTSSRAAQQPEARLAETERVLELVLRASGTAVVISDPETAVIHEVNDAFCRFTGRSREELLSGPAMDSWYDMSEREGVLEQVRHSGIAERVVVRIQRPDGSVRIGETTAHFVLLAGSRQLLSTVDDITEQHRLQAERGAVTAAYGALGQLAADLLAGRPVIESIAATLPELRSSGGFATALVWDAEHRRPVALEGEEPPPGLDRKLLRGRPVSNAGVLRLEAGSAQGHDLSGWAAPLAAGEHWVVLLCASSPASFSQNVFAEVLAGLAMIVSASGTAEVSGQ
jgi:PAS domain S-box-containing protein